MAITTLDQILQRAKKRKTRKIAVAAAADIHVLRAVKMAVDLNIIMPILVGEEKEIRKISAKIGFDLTNIEIYDVKAATEAARIAVKIVKEGKASILMKGQVSTAPLLKAVLDRENGLRKSETISHFALCQTSFYPKILGISDAGMNICPTIEEKIRIIENAVEVMHALDLEKPRVALLGPVEIVNEKITSTVDAAKIVKMKPVLRSGEYFIGGPYALDIAVSKEAAEQKGVNSEVAGNADILIVPGLDAGNILYKSLGFLSDGDSAAIICGAAVPIVLTSRADSEKTKLYSIALAAVI
jgi:phosphate butyryltransferase